MNATLIKHGGAMRTRALPGDYGVERLTLHAETDYDRECLAALAREFSSVPPEPQAAVYGDPATSTKRARVLRFLQIKGGIHKPAEIAAELGINSHTVRLCLSKMLAAGTVAQVGQAEYAIARDLAPEKFTEPRRIVPCRGPRKKRSGGDD